MHWFPVLVSIGMGLLLSGTESQIVELDSLKPFAGIDIGSMTVSGFSSGGFMSSSLQYMYSSKFKGAGLFAGGKLVLIYHFTPELIS